MGPSACNVPRVESLDFAAATHAGRVKKVNEDAICAEPPAFVVADGISGSHHGNIASTLVTDAFAELVRSGQPLTGDRVAHTLHEVHARVLEAQLRDGHDSATTACGAVRVMEGDQAYWMMFNIGDSRVYRITGRAREMTQISVDHSHVQELLDAGMITLEQAAVHPDKNVITRAVGAQDQFQPDFWLIPIVPGDRLLICSDGLLRDGDFTEVADIARLIRAPRLAVEQLMDLALANGARDNVSVIVVDVVGAAQGSGPGTTEFDERTVATPRVGAGWESR